MAARLSDWCGAAALTYERCWRRMLRYRKDDK